MILGIDYDQTIHDSHHPIPGRRMGPPIDGAVVALQTLRSEGHQIIILTARPKERQFVIDDWMGYYHIPYDIITNVKLPCDWYIDDRAIHFDNWFNVMGKIHGTETEAS